MNQLINKNTNIFKKKQLIYNFRAENKENMYISQYLCGKKNYSTY